MRILYFSRDYTTHDRRFLAKICERHEAFYLRLEDDGIVYDRRSVPDGVRVVPWAGGKDRLVAPESWLRLMPAYQKVIDQIRPDLIHAGPVQSCGFMTALSGFHPFLLMSWGSDILVDADRDEFWRWMTCHALTRADVFLCDSDEVVRRAGDLASYPRERVVQFPWGVDVRTFSPGEDTLQLRTRLGWQDCFLVMSSRAWEANYGVDTLIDAFRRALDANPRLRLILAGDGSRAERLQRRIDELNLRSFICLPGMISQAEMPLYFRAADLYVSCASSDGSSISLLEAMATGLPVAVTDRPSNREWVTPGENGWVVAADSPECFAEAMLSAADLDAAERARMAACSRRIVECRGNADANFARLFAAYDRMERASPAATLANRSLAGAHG